MSKSGLARIAALAAVLSLAYWSPALLVPGATGLGDWQMVHHNFEVGWVALTRFGEWPLWDPYHCGGVTMLGNPESQHFTPWFLASLLFRGSDATTLAIKLMLIAHTAAGFVGMWLYARRVTHLSTPAAMLAAVAWTFSGFFAWHGAGGHGTFLAFDYLPLLLLLWRRSLINVRAAVGVAALLALTVAEGGTYPLPYMGLALLLEAALLLRRPESRRASMVAALVVGLLFPLLAAIRVLPIVDALRRYPREMLSIDRMSAEDLLLTLTERTHDWRWPGHEFVWPEYGAFVGWGVVVLAVLAVLFALPRASTSRVNPHRRATLAMTLGALIFFALVVGNGALRPWPLLHTLPVFDSLRVPSRFLGVATFYLAVLAGLALDRLARAGAPRSALRRTLVVLAWLMVLGTAIDIAATTRPIVDRWKDPPIGAEPSAREFHLVHVANYQARYARLPRSNTGTSGCYEGAMRWNVAAGLWTGDGPQVRVPRPGRLIASERTPSHLFAEVELPQPARVVWNSNFDPGWQPSVGTLVDDNGRLAIDLPAGRHRLDVRFRPALLLPSLVLSALGALLAAAVTLSRALRRALRLEGRMR